MHGSHGEVWQQLPSGRTGTHLSLVVIAANVLDYSIFFKSKIIKSGCGRPGPGRLLCTWEGSTEHSSLRLIPPSHEAET